MNKRYMDFVPKGKNIPAKKPVEVKKSVPVAEEPEVISYTEEVVTEEFLDATPDVAIEEFLAVDTNPRRMSEPEYGVIEAKPAEKPAEKAPETPEKKSEKEEFKTPKTRFVNTEKVEKRPLSKNVYKKTIVAPKEEPSGPVTIITKPDKGSHIGVIVTIVLTIILGAAAGTVAFLLLPK